jgi:GNAT superfamily N-acetyltransferase
METTARVYMSRGECWGAFENGALRAAMMTLPPGGYPLPLQSDLALFWLALRTGGLAATVRFARTDVLLRKHHTRTEHHYLFLLGTDPDFQGKGFGSRLLQGLGEHAGARACYLETDRSSSVKLYERHGYRVVHHQQSPLGERAFPLWFMLREPA